MFSAVTFRFSICLASIGYGEGDGEAEKWEGRDDMAIKWGQWGLLCAEGPWHHNPNITLVALAFALTQSLGEDIIAKSKRFLEQEKCLASTHGLVLQGFQCLIFVRSFCLDLIMHLYALMIRPICSDAKWSGIFSKCIYLHTSTHIPVTERSLMISILPALSSPSHPTTPPNCFHLHPVRIPTSHHCSQ